MEGQGQAEVANMEMNLNLLAAVPSIAPMLGLLGTVIGMILAFFNLSNSTGSFSPKTLSEGIYTALGQQLQVLQWQSRLTSSITCC